MTLAARLTSWGKPQRFQFPQQYPSTTHRVAFSLLVSQKLLAADLYWLVSAFSGSHRIDVLTALMFLAHRYCCSYVSCVLEVERRVSELNG